METNPRGLRTRFAATNGINLHVADEGVGELVILVHGFPQCWYIWRNQIEHLRDAGYRAVAPDQRGYGRSDRPGGVEDYDILSVTADIVGLADELGVEKFYLVGQDWGCITAWHVALLYPHRVHGVLGFSVPYVPSMLRNWIEPSSYRDEFWYSRYFLQPGRAERELEADIRRSLMWLWWASSGGNDFEVTRITSGGPKDRGLLDGLGPTPDSVPGCTQADLDYCVGLYEDTGFRGPLSYYRNLARLPALTPWLEGAPILVPAMFAYGDAESPTKRPASFDASLSEPPVDEQDAHFVDLMAKVCIPDAGHWPMFEQPAAVNALLDDFLARTRARVAAS